MKGNENGGLQQIIDKALADMGHDRASGGFDPGAVNLAEFQRLTGLSRSRAGTLRKKGFSCVHGRTGSRAETTVLTGFEDELDGLIRSGATNSSACFDRIRAKGYPGGPARVKEYIAARSHLAPPARSDTVNVFFTNRANGSAPSAQMHFHQSRKRAFAASG